MTMSYYHQSLLNGRVDFVGFQEIAALVVAISASGFCSLAPREERSGVEGWRPRPIGAAACASLSFVPKIACVRFRNGE